MVNTDLITEVWEPANYKTVSDYLSPSPCSITCIFRESVEAHTEANSQAGLLISSQSRGDLPE